MKRRQLMLGIGATTGGVSIVSSGAFTSTSADRDVTVRVADDAGSYLGLSVGSGPNGVFAMSTADDTDTSNGQLGINLTNARARVARASARTQPRCPSRGWRRNARQTRADAGGLPAERGHPRH